MNNRLFVANKPTGLSSNRFLGEIKRKYKIKKAGYSGTLDPFANGTLVIAFGQYTKLFRFLNKEPKVYRATLYLGAFSETLDSEKIEEVEEVKEVNLNFMEDVVNSLKGEIEYLPPKYCAKSIDGKKAYNLARAGIDFELKKIKSSVFDIKLISYKHPFIDFEIKVSEGAYIRSLGLILAQRLGTTGALTKLNRVSEGEFVYENEKELNPLKYLKTEENRYLLNKDDILLGKKLRDDSFQNSSDGVYHLINDNMLSIIKIANGEVSYELNRIRMQGC